MGESMTKLFEMLEGLAAKLGTTVEELAPHVVAHTRAKAIGQAGAIVFFTILIAAGFFFGAISVKGRGWFDEDKPRAGFVVAVICSVMSVILMLATAIEGPSTLAALLEPTGATVKAIFKL